MTDTQQRIDKWLWFSRRFRTRTLAAKIVTSGKIRVNNQRITKVSHAVQIGDTLTFMANKQVKILKVAGIGARRGPASEAVELYEDLSPPDLPKTKVERSLSVSGQRDDGSGRPTKKQRREIDALMGRDASVILISMLRVRSSVFRRTALA